MAREGGIGNPIRIAPVGVNVGVGGGAFPWLGDPLTMQLMKNLVTPVFKGINEDWPRFLIEWEKYLQKLSTGRKVTYQEKLQLLESCLDANDRRKLQFLSKASRGAGNSFQ